jgi:phytoene synthase
LTRREAKNFYFAFLPLPQSKRRAIYAVYAFCREADDIADRTAPLSTKVAELARLRTRLADAAAGRPREKTDLALSDTMARFFVDAAHLSHMIDGVEMDLTVSRYATFEDLRHYCFLVASAVGLTVLPILLGPCRQPLPVQAREKAIALGLGLQLANIVRDVAEDLRRGRIYLPQEDLGLFGITEDALLRGEISGRMRKLLSFQVGRARAYLADGQILVSYLPRHTRSCPMLLGEIYARILDRIEERDYDVFSSRVSLSTFEKLALTVGVGMKTLRR